MYVDPFVCGFFSAIFLEVILLVAYACTHRKK